MLCGVPQCFVLYVTAPRVPRYILVGVARLFSREIGCQGVRGHRRADGPPPPRPEYVFTLY